MISYLPLDNNSLFSCSKTLDKSYNLSKNISIEIAPLSDYIYKHGFYFCICNGLKFYVQLDKELLNKLNLECYEYYDDLNNVEFKLTNKTKNIVVIEPYTTIINLSSNDFKLNNLENNKIP